MFNTPWMLNGAEYYSTMSMGIVCYPDDGEEVNELIKRADIAMYDAKKAGKNTVRYYNAKDERTSIKRLDVEKNMRSAIAVGGMEFELYIQPIMDANTGECKGGESLIRWNSKELGFLMPVDFIPLAEHLGLIVIIGEYFLRKACRINRQWSDRGIDKQLHVNLSIVQLVQNNVVETITNIIKETGVKPENIILEVTESLAINDMTNMKKVIKEIKKLGVGIALDDFGTGYSSLNYIKQMDFDIIKVDKHFIDDLTTDDYAQTFVKLITELSDKLGAKVCVEGVEDSAQLQMLRDMNVNFIQGYYYGKPIPYEEFEKKFLGITR
jgi:EAL domain-containing protein (putative c-di-GMP-specific phosphodiesterase class I)